MKEIFCDEYVLQAYDELSAEMVLKEEETKQKITIGGIPDNSILIKLDIDRSLYKVKSKYLRKGVEFIHKGCDYCLIMPDRQQAVLFELKSNNPKGYIDQFAASEIFVNYCVNLWNRSKCNQIQLTFIKVLLSPKYNYGYTANDKMHILTMQDRCNNDVRIMSPGFPSKIRLEKFL